MKSIVIYESVHNNNTEKVAKVIANEIDAELVHVGDFLNSQKDLADYDLVGFGSGIYYGKIHKNIKKLIENVEHKDFQRTFIFTTSGTRNEDYNNKFKEFLNSKGFDVIADFSCRGFASIGFWKIIKTVSKGRPNEKDLDSAKNFARSISI